MKKTVEQAAEEYANKDPLTTNGGFQWQKSQDDFIAGHAYALEQASEGFEEWFKKEYGRSPDERRIDLFSFVSWQAATLAAEKKNEKIQASLQKHIELLQKGLFESQSEGAGMLVTCESLEGADKKNQEMLKDLDWALKCFHEELNFPERVPFHPDNMRILEIREKWFPKGVK